MSFLLSIYLFAVNGSAFVVLRFPFSLGTNNRLIEFNFSLFRMSASAFSFKTNFSFFFRSLKSDFVAIFDLCFFFDSFHLKSFFALLLLFFDFFVIRKWIFSGFSTALYAKKNFFCVSCEAETRKGQNKIDLSQCKLEKVFKKLKKDL